MAAEERDGDKWRWRQRDKLSCQSDLEMGWKKKKHCRDFACEGGIFMLVCVCVRVWSRGRSRGAGMTWWIKTIGRKKEKKIMWVTNNFSRQWQARVHISTSYHRSLCCICCKINYLSGNKRALQDISLGGTFPPITHTITLCQRNFSLLKIIHHLPPV